MNTFERLLQNTPTVEAKLGYKFKEKNLLVLAFTHRSFINECRSVDQHNERLEFLGDSVLGLLVSDYLYRHLPTTPEGELSTLRSRLVEATSCMQYVQALGVTQYMLLGKGELMNDGRGRESLQADLFEAIVGAIYIDGGFEEAKRFLFKHFSSHIEEILKTPTQNYKAQLQDYCQKHYQKPPVYQVVQETGPDHSKLFTIHVFVNDEEMGTGEGNSKKVHSKMPLQRH